MVPLDNLYRGILCCESRDRRPRRCCQLCVHMHLSTQGLHSPIAFVFIGWVTHSSTTASLAEVMFLLSEGPFILVWFALAHFTVICVKFGENI